jgi:cytochrome P450
MVLHPDAQSRAQTEIDNVVGMDRLPNFDDEISLPYVSTLVGEVMRWHPVAPSGTHYHYYHASYPLVNKLLYLQRFLTA